MTSSFLRSERRLASDRYHGSALGIIVVSGLMVLWFLWFFCARVCVYAVSESADLEVDRAAHSVKSPMSGRVIATKLVLDREVAAREVLVELDAEPQILQLNEESIRLEALKPQISSLQRELDAETRGWHYEQQASAVALDEARARHAEAEAAAGFAELQAKRFQQMYSSGVLSREGSERAQAQSEEQRAAADSLRFAITRLDRQQRTQEEDRLSHIQDLRSEINRTRGIEATTAAEVGRLEQEVNRRRLRAAVVEEWVKWQTYALAAWFTKARCWVPLSRPGSCGSSPAFSLRMR